MQKNLYEIFEEFKKAKTDLERREILQKHANVAFLSFLKLAFDKRIKFNVNHIPEYKPLVTPAGMGYSNYANSLKKLYLFIVGGPQKRGIPEPTEKRRTEILIQLLESLEAKEAEVFVQMFKQDLKVPYLTPKLLAKTFPKEFGDLRDL